MPKPYTHFFSGANLNRLSFKRAENLIEFDVNSKLVLFHSLRHLQKSNASIHWFSLQEAKEKRNAAIFLGLDEIKNETFWALDVTDVENFDIVTQALKTGSEFVDSRPAFMNLQSREASILAQARSLIDWNSKYRFCPSCGSITQSLDWGYKKSCKNSKCISHAGAQSICYPRTDPVVIILVISPCEQKVLLGRQKRYGKAVYSCIAGFIEPGESLEEAARREVLEESNIQVGKVIYHSSQPWPFPSNLMLACVGISKSEDIKLNDKELEDAQWFTKDQVRQGMKDPKNSTINIPPRYAIANSLITDWINNQLELNSKL
jgi:NAD+ diphosphatase